MKRGYGVIEGVEISTGMERQDEFLCGNSVSGSLLRHINKERVNCRYSDSLRLDGPGFEPP